MIKNLVSFGCSWTYGDELLDPNLAAGIQPHMPINDPYRLAHSYPGLIASRLGLDYECLAHPGASLQSMQWQFDQWLSSKTDEEKQETLVLVGLTEELQTSWINPYVQFNPGPEEDDLMHKQYMHSSWIRDSKIKNDPHWPSWEDFYKLYEHLVDSKASRKLNYATCVRLFDGAAARYNIPMLQYNVLATTREPKLPTLLDTTSLMEILVIRNKPRKEPLFLENKHPNEKGHRVMAEYLLEKLQSVII